MNAFAHLVFFIIAQILPVVNRYIKNSQINFCVVNRYDPKRPEKIKDMVLQRICAAGVEP